MTIKDCFKILKIEETFDKKIIKKAYRKQVLALHPDKNNKNSSEDFILVKKAYHFLMNSLLNDMNDAHLLKSRYNKIYEADKNYKDKIKRHKNKNTAQKNKTHVNNSKINSYSIALTFFILVLIFILIKYVL